MPIMHTAQITKHEEITEFLQPKNLRQYPKVDFSDIRTAAVAENSLHLVPLAQDKSKTVVQSAAAEVTTETHITPLVKTVLEHGSPIAILLLLIWLFKAMTQFVKICRED
jgi:hypothetical protein